MDSINISDGFALTALEAAALYDDMQMAKILVSTSWHAYYKGGNETRLTVRISENLDFYGMSKTSKTLLHLKFLYI